MKLIPFQGLFPKTDLIADSDSFFGNAKYKYPKFHANGFFEKEPSEALYLYQVENPYGKHIGIVATLDIMDLLDERVLEHEKTLGAKEQEQLQLTLERRAFIKPVLLGFHSFDEYQKFIRSKTKPDADVTIKLKKKKETHRFWKITQGSEVEELIKMFAQHVPKAYIADGHHRCSIARILWYQSYKEMISLKMDSLLTVLMPFSELKIHDYNRVVQLNEDLSYIDFLVRLSKYMNVKPIKKLSKPAKKHEMIMSIDQSWFKCTWKKSILKKHKKEKYILDYALLNQYVMAKILNIVDIRDFPGITYVPGVDSFKGIENAISKVEKGVGFMMYPLTSKEMCYYADNKKILPPKSSYFLPRIVNGMIVQELR